MAEPRGFVVVGDTDWWSVEHRHVSIVVDASLRKVSAAFGNGSNWRSVYSEGARTFRDGDVRVFELEHTAGDVMFGVSVSRTLLTDWFANFAGPATAARSTGLIYKNGVNTQSGLGAWSAGDRITCEITGTTSGVSVQFKRNGANFGTAETLATSTVYIGWASRGPTASGRLSCDGQEVIASGQPWGAAALVADRGGYSPAPTTFSSAGGSISLDAYRRTATDTVTGTDMAIAADAPDIRQRAGFVYFEVPIETDTGTLGYVGLALRSAAVTLIPGEVAAGGGSFFVQDGRKFTGGSLTAYGSGATVGQVVGVIYHAPTGKTWFSVQGTVQAGGDPEALTGEAFTITGDLVPAVTPYQSRMRLCTHAREQLYRPAYAEAWDGADLLPEQHFGFPPGVNQAGGGLKSAPSVRREVSYYPWANQRNRGAAIGNLDLNNASGCFDALSDYDLRDQEAVAYVVREDGSTAREFTGIVDGITLPDFRTCRVSIADKTAALDVRVDAPVFALGAPELIPARSRIGSTIAYDIAQSTFVDFRVYDQAAEVTSWVRSDVGDVSGFQRTVNPAGLHSVADFELVDEGTEATISNNSFDNWTAGSPDNWTKWDIGTAGTVVQSGSAAVITANVGGDTGIYHALALTSGQAYLLRIKIDAISGVSTGNVSLCIENSAGSFLNLADGESIGPGTFTTTGVFNVIFTPGSSFNGFSIYASLGASATVDYVQVWPVTQTTSTLDAIQYLMTLGGFGSADYVESFWPAYRPGAIGFWSEDRPTLRAILDQIAQTALVDYYTDADGVVRLAWLMPPEEVTIAADGYLGEIAERDVFGELSVADDYAPRLTTVAEYQRNYIQHSSADVAGSVFTSDKPWASYVQSERRENTLDTSSVSAGEAGPLHPFYAFANDAPVWPRLFVDSLTDSNTKNDASATTDNRLILMHRCYMQRRRFYRCRISRAKASELGLRPAGVVELTHNRYGLAAGKNLMVVGIEASLMTPTVAVTLWG